MKIFLMVVIVIGIHLIGGIIAILIHYKNGTMEYASKYGDGIRFAKPSGVIAIDLILWEISLLLWFMDFIADTINNHFEKKYKLTKEEDSNE